MDSTPGGDDQVAGATITTGADGICNTAVSGDDVQTIAVGNGKANENCVTAGTNAKRDTKTSGDDTVVGENITTGPDGICNTSANATDVSPVNVPSAAALQTYLNDTAWGKQANVHFTVTRSDSTVNFDLDLDGMLDDPYATPTGGPKSPQEWGEINEVTAAAKDAGVDFNIYYVKDYEYPVALSDPTRGEAWVGDLHSGSTEYVTAHEVGYLIGRVGHAGAAIGVDLMGATDSGASPCRIIKVDWDYVNPN